MTGDQKRGDAVADKWRDTFEKNRRESEHALTRLDVRADMKSMGEEEISEVIDQRALERRRQESEPPSGKVRVATAVLKLLPEGWGRVIVVLAVIAAVTYLVGKGVKLF